MMDAKPQIFMTIDQASLGLDYMEQKDRKAAIRYCHYLGMALEDRFPFSEVIIVIELALANDGMLRVSEDEEWELHGKNRDNVLDIIHHEKERVFTDGKWMDEER